MSFTNLKYDECQQAQNVKESIGPGQYILNTPYTTCTPLYIEDPRIRLQKIPLRTGESNFNNKKIEIESEILGITRKSSKCATQQFPFVTYETNESNCSKEISGFNIEDSRLNNPPATLRCTENNHYLEHVCKNPQEHFEIPFDNIINTRIITKDTHRPYLIKPLEQEKYPKTKLSNRCGSYDIRLCPQPIYSMK